MTLRELAAAIDAELVGEAGDAQVGGVTGLDAMAAGCIAYVSDADRLGQAEAGPALAALVPRSVTQSTKPLLRTDNPRLALAKALSLLYPAARLPAGVHPTAQVGHGVELGAGAAIGAHCVIGDGVKIGREAQLHPLVAVGAGVEIGESTVIYPNVTLYDGVRLGARVVVHAGSVIGSAGFGYVFDGATHRPLPHIGTVVVEDEVEIGANVTIDRATLGATIIGQGTKVDNLVHIAHNAIIGRNCLFAGQVGISGSVVVGDNVMLAGQAGIADHTTVGDGAIGGARAAIMQDVAAGAIVYGMPAHPRAEQLRIDAATRRLPELVRTVRELARRVAELEKKLGEGTPSEG